MHHFGLENPVSGQLFKKFLKTVVTEPPMYQDICSKDVQDVVCERRPIIYRNKEVSILAALHS